jgi:DNA-binding beta-propeller fold protein YncE
MLKHHACTDGWRRWLPRRTTETRFSRFAHHRGVRLCAVATVAVALCSVGGTALAEVSGGLPLRVVVRVALPGPSVRFDYTSLDPTSGRLYIAHMDASQLLVFDVKTRKVLATLPAPGVHGVIAVPQLGRVFASATDAREVLTIDANSDAIVARAPAGTYPDGLVYDPVERHVFVSDESGGVETVLSANGERIATITLGGQAGNVQYDAGSGHLLVDVQTLDQVAVIDPRSNRIIRRIPIPGCAFDHGLYVDSPRRLAFIACAENATLLTLDLRTMTVTGQATVGAAPDVLAFDPGLRRLYVSAESGVVTVFAETTNGLRKLGQAFLATEAHTLAVDPRTHLTYFPLQRGSTGAAQLLIMAPTR